MLLTFTLTYAGCTSLCLAMNRHFQQLWPNQKASQKTILILRLLGWFLLATAFAYFVKIQGVAVALVCLCGFVSAAAFTLILLLSYLPRVAVFLAVTTPFFCIAIY